MDETVDMVTESTPQGSPATLDLMEEENTIEEEVVTTLTIKPMEEREQIQEGPKVEETRGPVEEAVGELGCEVDTDPQELASTSGLTVEDSFQFSFFIPQG